MVTAIDIDPSLYRKIAEVVTEVEKVDKDKRNDFHGYDYASAEAILTVLRGPLAAKHVALMPSISDVSERPYTTDKGRESVITTIRVTFTFVDGDTGSMHRCDWAGQGDDPGDKGLGKAYTNALKTFLRDVFLLPQGDDPEADSKTDERSGSRQSSGPRRSSGGGAASDAQKKFLRQLITQNSLNAEVMDALFRGAGFARGEGEKVNDAINRLSKQQCSTLIEAIKDGPVRTGESDVPSSPDEFTHPEPVEDPTLPFDPSVPS